MAQLRSMFVALPVLRRLLFFCIFRSLMSILITYQGNNIVINIIGADALQFQYASFQLQPAAGQEVQDGNTNAAKYYENITLLGHNDWYDSANAYLANDAIWLTAVQNSSLNNASVVDSTNLGRVVYKDPISFYFDDDDDAIKNVTSFSTFFTFQIITTRPFPDCGSGMAFFIADSLQAPSNSDNRGALGLLDPYNDLGELAFFAVEFDTHVSPTNNDPSGSHIGINVNSMISLSTTDTSPTSTSSSTNPFYPQLFLYSNSTFTTWIEYNASSHLTQVWMTNHTASASNLSGPEIANVSVNRPLQPCLKLQYDLSVVLARKPMYMGFSATTAPSSSQGMEGHVIYSWSFSNEITQVSYPRSAPRFKLYQALAPAAAALVLIAIVVAPIWRVLVKRRQNQRKRANALGRIEGALQTARPFSYKELKRATNGFDEKRKVGEGGYGSVYRGILSDGSVVAVKKLKRNLMLEAQFCAEASIIRKVRHRYLLELQGWCYEDEQEALLVSQYMSKGSLDGYLFDARKKKLLGNSPMAQKETRMRILAQVAAALDYLHGGLGDCVLHRDVKAANVLLTDDKEMEARLCDFGLARLIGHDEGAVTMTAAGTPGYVAPELLYDGMATDKADVYSFGVLALEAACGRRAIVNQQHITHWLWTSVLKNCVQGGKVSEEQLYEALDPILLRHADRYINMAADNVDVDTQTTTILQDWRCVVQLGLTCCHPSPENRPSMKEVSRALDTKRLFLLPACKPPSPYDFVFSSPTISCTTTSTQNTASASGSSSSTAASTAAVVTSTSSSSGDSRPAASLLSGPR